MPTNDLPPEHHRTNGATIPSPLVRQLQGGDPQRRGHADPRGPAGAAAHDGEVHADVPPHPDGQHHKVPGGFGVGLPFKVGHPPSPEVRQRGGSAWTPPASLNKSLFRVIASLLRRPSVATCPAEIERELRVPHSPLFSRVFCIISAIFFFIQNQTHFLWKIMVRITVRIVVHISTLYRRIAFPPFPPAYLGSVIFLSILGQIFNFLKSFYL